MKSIKIMVNDMERKERDFRIPAEKCLDVLLG
jgi:hypothetical protein